MRAFREVAAGHLRRVLPYVRPHALAVFVGAAVPASYFGLLTLISVSPLGDSAVDAKEFVDEILLAASVGASVGLSASLLWATWRRYR